MLIDTRTALPLLLLIVCWWNKRCNNVYLYEFADFWSEEFNGDEYVVHIIINGPILTSIYEFIYKIAIYGGFQCVVDDEQIIFM